MDDLEDNKHNHKPQISNFDLTGLISKGFDLSFRRLEDWQQAVV